MFERKLTSIQNRQIASWTMACMAAVTSWTNAAETPDFQHDVLPLLKQRCVQCHGPAKKAGELSLALATGIRRGGEHGAAIVAGEPEQSLLWQRIARD